MKWLGFGLLTCLLWSCSQSQAPDVSNINASLQARRFEQDFFALDTNNMQTGLQKLQAKYPEFYPDFIYNILGLPPGADSVMANNSQMTSFLKAYAPLKDSADKIIGDLSEVQQDVQQGLQYVKYYFPEYKLPTEFISFVGPINSYGNILTSNAVAVGLQMYLGKNFSIYNTEAGQQLYPAYISRRFEKAYIPINCIRTIVDDIFPDNSAALPLVMQMVQAGKRLYVLNRLMPNTADTLITGYTAQQLAGCYENEETIWSFFVQKDLLFVNDPAVVRDYMNDAPSTQAFGNDSPGAIGQFVGWQIVKKWMEKKKDISLQQLLQTDPKVIYTEAKYKP